MCRNVDNSSRCSVVLSDRKDLPNIDHTEFKQVDQTTSNINREPKPPRVFIPGVIRDFSAMIEQVAGNGNCTHKTIDSNGQLKIMAKDSDVSHTERWFASSTRKVPPITRSN